MKEKTPMELRREAILAEQKNGYTRIGDGEANTAYDFCEGYKAFMNTAKTERESVSEIVRMAEAAGFRKFSRGDALKTGDKLYSVNRGKAINLAVIGEYSLKEGANIAAAHIDAPRIDLKPNPLYEDGEMGYFKTHYYGGIKKYQWVTIPLELRGVIALKNGETITITPQEGDPLFVITDLLPHLAADQMKKSLSDGITGEGLNVLLGSRPMADDEGSDKVKFALMSLLNEKYGITESDFLSAELSFVPALKAADVGFDRSLIGAYGQDDRICSYAAFAALVESEKPKKTAVCVLADKEEIGSEGVSGMKSAAFDTFMDDLCDAQGVQLKACFENSCCLSADVSNAFDPNFADVSDKRNNARINYGVSICKYTGSRGKSGASDASAELMAKVRRIFDGASVLWQVAELGKVDQGGGGTVAAYMAERNIDTVDTGVPVLSMHAPWEVVSKLDTYMTYKGIKAFYEG